MLEFIIMALFIGIPAALLIGAAIAMIHRQRDTSYLEDLDVPGETPRAKTS